MNRLLIILPLFSAVYSSGGKENETTTTLINDGEDCTSANANENGSCNFAINSDGSIQQATANTEMNKGGKESKAAMDLNLPSFAPGDSKNSETVENEDNEEDVEYTYEFDTLPPEFKDLHEDCALWASEGACNADPLFMLKECVPSCLLNPEVQEHGLLSWTLVPEILLEEDCVDFHEAEKEKEEDGSNEDDDEDEEGCFEWMTDGLCRSDDDKPFMLSMCQRTCRVCHHPDDDEYELGKPQLVPQEILKETLNVLLDMATYIHKKFLDPKNTLYASTRSSCKNGDSLCAIYGAEGMCNPDHEEFEWMAMNCAPICQTCELQDFSIRCPIPEDAVDAFATHGGDNGLHAMFERIVGERNLTQTQVDDRMNEMQYKVNIISRPLDERKKVDDENDQDEEDNDDIIDGPWVITLEDFVTKEECEEMIKAGQMIGYHPSVETQTNRDGSQSDDFESDARTSTNAWCDDECRENPIIKRVQERIATVTGIPVENSEDLQLLHYETGQFYKVHHDLITAHVKGPSGPRVLTFFLYLNDLDEDAGGGTNFPELAPGASPVTIQPKRGTALVWPSVLDEDINLGDYRTEHEALPVKSGVKYGANAWLHLRKEDYEGIECG